MRQVCVGSPDIPRLNGCQCSGTYAWSGDAVHAPLTVLRMGPVD